MPQHRSVQISNKCYHRSRRAAERLLLISPAILMAACGAVEPADGPDVDAGMTQPDAGIDAGAQPACDVTEPFAEIKAVPNINSTFSEEGASISADELTLYYASNRDGDFQIFVARRTVLTDDFTNPSLSADVSLSGPDEAGPCISADDQTLYLDTTRAGGIELFVSTRSGSGVFTTPVALSAAVNTGVGETGPCAVNGGQALYFGRSQGAVGAFRATLGPTGFENPIELTELGANTAGLTPSEDEQTLYFASDRAGGEGGMDIYVAHRPAPGQPFGTPTAVTELNTDQDERMDWVSADGCRAYFWTNRAGGAGGFDVWQATRPALQ